MKPRLPAAGRGFNPRAISILGLSDDEIADLLVEQVLH
jgi:hypothetical protein